MVTGNNVDIGARRARGFSWTGDMLARLYIYIYIADAERTDSLLGHFARLVLNPVDLARTGHPFLSQRTFEFLLSQPRGQASDKELETRGSWLGGLLGPGAILLGGSRGDLEHASSRFLSHAESQ